MKLPVTGRVCPEINSGNPQGDFGFAELQNTFVLPDAPVFNKCPLG